MSLQERLNKIMNDNRLSMRQLGLSVDIDPSYLAKAMKGKVGLTLEKLEKIATTYNVDIDWLRGINEDNNPNLQEPQVGYLTKRRQLKNSNAEFRVPLVTVKARAGYVSSYDQIDLVNSLDKYAIPPGVSYVGAIWRYFEVDGDSMEPTLSSGDYVLCSQVPQDDWPNVPDFYVHVIVTDTELLIKRVFKKSALQWVLISDNESHTPQRLFDVEQLKELWVFRRLIKKTISPKKKFEIKI